MEYLKYYLLDWILGYAFNRYLKSFYEQIPVVYVPTPYIKSKMERLGYGRHTEIKFFERGVDMKLFDPQRRSAAFRASKGINDDDVKFPVMVTTNSTGLTANTEYGTPAGLYPVSPWARFPFKTDVT